MIHTATSSGSTGQVMCFGSKERWQIFLLESRPSDATNDCWWGVGTMGITGQCVQRHPSGKNLQLATISVSNYAMSP